MVIPPLPAEYELFVQGEVASGRFPSPIDVVCEALKQYREQQKRLSALRHEIHYQAVEDHLEIARVIHAAREIGKAFDE